MGLERWAEHAKPEQYRAAVPASAAWERTRRNGCDKGDVQRRHTENRLRGLPTGARRTLGDDRLGIEPN